MPPFNVAHDQVRLDLSVSVALRPTVVCSWRRGERFRSYRDAPIGWSAEVRSFSGLSSGWECCLAFGLCGQLGPKYVLGFDLASEL